MSWPTLIIAGGFKINRSIQSLRDLATDLDYGDGKIPSDKVWYVPHLHRQKSLMFSQLFMQSV